MHDDTPFLRAVCEAPFDDGPRLVWADALDERGDPRGEFVRVQCELAATSMRACAYESEYGSMFGTCGCRRCVLRRRERELLLSPPPGCAYSRAESWTPAALRSGAVACEVSTQPPTFRSLRSGVAWGFRRGLVGSVTMTCQQFLGGPCGRCGGTGRVSYDDGWNCPDMCPDCRGTGRVEGVAAALFVAAPVTEVRLSDRGPDSISDGRLAWWYTDPDWHRPGLHQHHWLPVELRPHLTGRTCEPIDEPRPGVCGFDYGDSFAGTDGVGLARADLSAACVKYGRSLVRPRLPAQRQGGLGS
jgi:uncharacterized protein (TIGR02996 family)